MTFGQLITSRIGALADGRVFCVKIPARAVAPYVVWFPITDIPQVTHSDIDALSKGYVQVDCYAESTAEADDLRRQVKNAMVADTSDIWPVNLGPVVEVPDTEPQLFKAQGDFEFIYAPSS